MKHCIGIVNTHFYVLDNGSIEYVTTRDDFLVISTKAVKSQYTIYNDRSNPYFAKEPSDSIVITKNYTSGMVMSWNKFCFTGGILEVSLELPGDGQSSGLWPAVWLMGNLARANYPESTLVSPVDCTKNHIAPAFDVLYS